MCMHGICLVHWARACICGNVTHQIHLQTWVSEENTAGPLARGLCRAQRHVKWKEEALRGLGCSLRSTDEAQANPTPAVRGPHTPTTARLHAPFGVHFGRGRARQRSRVGSCTACWCTCTTYAHPRRETAQHNTQNHASRSPALSQHGPQKPCVSLGHDQQSRAHVVPCH